MRFKLKGEFVYNTASGCDMSMVCPLVSCTIVSRWKLISKSSEHWLYHQVRCLRYKRKKAISILLERVWREDREKVQKLIDIVKLITVVVRSFKKRRRLLTFQRFRNIYTHTYTHLQTQTHIHTQFPKTGICQPLLTCSELRTSSFCLIVVLLFIPMPAFKSEEGRRFSLLFVRTLQILVTTSK